MATTTAVETQEPPVPQMLREAVNHVRHFLGQRPVPPAIWVNGQPLHLRDEITFSLDLARTRYAFAIAQAKKAGRQLDADDAAYVVESIEDSDRFLRAYWGPNWHELVAW